MLYDSFEFQRSILDSASVAARFGATWLSSPANPLSYTQAGPLVASALEVFAHASRSYGKPAWNLPATVIDGVEVAVTEEVILDKPFCKLVRFRRETERDDPKLLVVAPMSGHHATLLRGTVERLLPRFDVHVTDWVDAKMVPLSAGRFDLDDYVDHVIEFLETIGGGAHVVAVCQPTVPVFIALSLMSARNSPFLPATATLMGGPIDPRQAPTAVNAVAMNRPLAWFEQNVIATVPLYYPGAFRRVYPGFLQLAGFMSMNLGNHLMSHWEMFKHLVQGDGESAEASKAFYEEYRAVADLPAEFYLQTIDVVFQRHLLPRGEMLHRGERVDPSQIRTTAILCIEGERDDISGLGQTRAALDLASGLADAKKRYLMAKGVGHYGIFNGRRWRTLIAPAVEDFIAEFDPGPRKPRRAHPATETVSADPNDRNLAKPENALA